MAIYGYTKNYKLIKPQFNTDTWHDYIYDNLDTIDAVMSAIYASGNWKGFWATNTVYTVGDVIIDQSNDTMYKVMVDHTTSEATFAEEFAAHPTYYELWSPNNLAESWAIKMDDVVSNTDYSSKAYAISSGLIDVGSAKEWAIKTGGSIGTTGEYSAKKHATDAASSASTAIAQASAASASATLAQQWAVDANLVASTDYSSKSWATGSLDAGSAKDWAIKEGGSVGTTGKYSAKVYSLAAQNHYEKAVDWASKTNGLVEGTDYSAKAYAISEGLISDGSAKEWSNKAKAWATSSTIVEDGKYGASYYALQAYNANVSAQTAKTTAQEWASKTDAQVASTDYSSKAYAQSEGLISSGSSKEWATKSSTWAEGSDADVAVLGGTHSSKTWADNSEIWAEGTDEQVQALGGVHSSKVWAEQSTNANIALTNSPYTTNRILEIPQDIKLELNNGTLTLKAGSKVYVPNGFESDGITPKFDVKIIENDISTRFGTGRKECIVVVDNDNALQWGDAPAVGSGSSPFGGIYYNTSTNLIVSPAGWFNANASLPIGVITEGSDDVESIDQVFNGFGYIGSTVFVLPGVKAQAPNGRNDDGTYKSNIFTVDNVKTVTFTSADSPKGQPLIIRPNTAPCVFYANWHFDETTGYIVTDSGVVSNAGSICVAGSLSVDAGKITRLVLPNVDSVVNSNASNFSQAGRSYLSGLGMPSSKYVDLTLGGSGVGYTAPANGYFSLLKGTTAAGQYINFSSFFGEFTQHLCSMVFSPATGYGVGGFIPVRKGDQIHISYTAAGTVTYFRFIYAEGEN